MFKTILIPLDGSLFGERALPLALRLARGAGIRLLLLQAAGDLALLTRLEAELGIAVTLEPHLDALRRSGAEATPGLGGPLSFSEILRVVREDDVDLVVMSLEGDVADEVLRRTPVPVLLVPPTCDRRSNAQRTLRLLVPLDGSRHAEAALASARELAETVSTELLLVRAVRTPTPDPYWQASDGQSARTPGSSRSMTEARQYLETIASTQGAAFASVDILVGPGEPAEVIIDAAHAKDVDLIATAARGRRDGEGYALGGAMSLLQRAHVPVLITPSHVSEPQSAEGLTAATHR